MPPKNSKPQTSSPEIEVVKPASRLDMWRLLMKSPPLTSKEGARSLMHQINAVAQGTSMRPTAGSEEKSAVGFSEASGLPVSPIAPRLAEQKKEVGESFKKIEKYKADFIIDDKIVLEIKAISCLTSAHVKQTLNYLAVSKLKLGLLINFGKESLKYKRIVFFAFVAANNRFFSFVFATAKV